MRVKGRERAEHPIEEDIEEQIKENAELLKTDWWKEIATDRIPFAPRPKGGARINFFSYNNLQDMALEIKESFYGFKHTGDVHRTAHYIGMYLLREKYAKNKKSRDLDSFMSAAEEEMKRSTERRMMLERFQACWDQFVESTLTQGEFDIVVEKMQESIKNEATRKWFDETILSIFNDDVELRKSRNRQHMQQVRAKIASLKVYKNSSM